MVDRLPPPLHIKYEVSRGSQRLMYVGRWTSLIAETLLHVWMPMKRIP